MLDLEDVSLKGHDARVIVEELKDTSDACPKRAINSIVSDSAANCKKARRDIVAERGYKHLIQHRCLAHFVNLIGARISGNGPVSALVNSASKLSGMISSSTYWTAYLKDHNLKKTQTVCSVRWYRD